jgi:hypothetical protein
MSRANKRLVAINQWWGTINNRLIAVNKALVAIKQRLAAIAQRLVTTSHADHRGDQRVITRSLVVLVATNRSIMRTNQRLGHLIHLKAPANKSLARDIQELIHMITDRSCGTYKAWLA